MLSSLKLNREEVAVKLESSLFNPESSKSHSSKFSSQ